MATINDKAVQEGDHYIAEVLSAQDFYPFGMLQPDRRYTLGAYRYGFNGKENDNEVKGEGNQQDYGMRVYDPRIGKFLSVDPLFSEYAFYTPYQFAGNKPIWAIDRDGLEDEWYQKAKVKLTSGTLFLSNKVSNIAQGTISNVTLFTTGVAMPIINQAHVIYKEGPHPSGAYDINNNVAWAVPNKFENWKFTPQKQMMGNVSFEDGKDIINASVGTVLTFTPFKFGIASTGSKMIDKGIEMGLNSVTKTAIKKGPNLGLETISPSPSQDDEAVVDIDKRVVPIYLIKKGETLSGIAQKTGTTVDVLAKDNNIKDPNKINVGQLLKINN